MADLTPNTVRTRGLRGITPFLAAGHGSGDFSTIAADAIATMTIADAEVTPDMIVFAQVQGTAELVVLSAVAGNKQVVIKVINLSGGAATAQTTKIAYVCIPSEKD